jgi:putative dehydrogenase
MEKSGGVRQDQFGLRAKKMTTVGLIGLGAMGSGMAQSLRRAGHLVQVFDVRRDAAQAFARDGGTAHESLASMGAASDVVVSVVVNAAQTEAGVVW